MVIEVRRQWIALTPDRPNFEAVVWRQEGPPFTAPGSLRTAAPDGYRPGLLCGYIDGQAVGQGALWAAIDLEAS